MIGCAKYIFLLFDTKLDLWRVFPVFSTNVCCRLSDELEKKVCSTGMHFKIFYFSFYLLFFVLVNNFFLNYMSTQDQNSLFSPTQSSQWAPVLRPKTNNYVRSSKFFKFLFRYIYKIKSGIRFEPVNSNFHMEDCKL